MKDGSTAQHDNEKRYQSSPPPKGAKNPLSPPVVESDPKFRSATMTSASFQSPSSLQSDAAMRLSGDPASLATFGLKRDQYNLVDSTKERSIPSNISKEQLVSSRYNFVDNTKERSIPSNISEGHLDEPNPYFKPLPVQPTWVNPKLRNVPEVYMLERSNRIINDSEHKLEDITRNLSECFRVLGIQAKYFERPAGVALLTHEQVEIFVYLWKTGGGKQVCVEVQNRRGDSLIFHGYARHILEAASGDFDPESYYDYSDQQYLKAAEKLLRTELIKVADQAQESHAAVEMAANLITKDRLDQRMLGMESLCILTDPRKTNLNTALLASSAVLFGEGDPTFHSIHEFVLNIVQKRRMGDDAAFLEDMVVEYDSDDEDYFEDDELKDESKPPEYISSIKTLLNYGLTILANSWEVLATFESIDPEPELTHGSLFSIDAAVSQFRRMASDLTHTDILTSLLTELGRPEKHAHNACLAAKCLRILCQSSPSACERTKSLSGWERAFRAEQVGKETNSRLKRESTHLLKVLQE